MVQPLKIAIAGLGTVGGGTFELLRDNAALLAARCGRPLTVTAVAEPNAARVKELNVGAARHYTDALAMVAECDMDVVVELIGGSDGIAKKLVEAALAKGKHIVTANKALLAHHGAALARTAEASGATLAFEAAVAGGIPIIKALREGLAANNLKRVFGILNGTCNYILTAMRDSGREFADVLAEAQKLGYAEADPSFDVDGIDTAHKLAILTSLAFGTEVNLKAVHIEGIRHISPVDITFAEELGYRIKLLGIASQTEHGIEQRVHPCMVPLASPIAKVDGVFNAVVAEGDFVGSTLFQGRGAGAKPTASAVVADLIDIARGRSLPAFALPAAKLKPLTQAAMARHFGAYYVRLMVTDKPGVFAEIATVLRDHQVSMESVIQRTRSPGEAVPVVMTVHETQEAAMAATLETIARLGTVTEPPRMIRIEAL